MTGINDFSFSPKIHHKFGTISQSMVGTYSDTDNAHIEMWGFKSCYMGSDRMGVCIAKA